MQLDDKDMQKHLLWSIGFMIIVLLNTPTICSPQSLTRIYHSASGAYQGKSVQEGNTTTYYNKQGSVVGKSVRQGNTVTHYDKSGRMVNRIIQPGNTKKPYSSVPTMVRHRHF